MKRLIAELIVLCIAVLIITASSNGEVLGWRFTEDLFGHNLTYLTDNSIGSSLAFHIIIPADNTGLKDFPDWCLAGDGIEMNETNNYYLNGTQSFTIEMWKLILLQKEITLETVNDPVDISHLFAK